MTLSTARRRDALPPAPSSSRRLRALLIFAVFLVSVVGAAIVGWRFAEASKPLAGPIVLISIDTLRADRLAIYGHKGVATPHLDRLARAGFVFDRAYAHSPQTLPSHTSMLTGLLPFEHGVRDDVGFTLNTRHATLARLLGDRGFETGAAVSSFVLGPDTGIGHGFAAYNATLPDADPASPAPTVARDGARTIEVAEKWIDAERSSRFFYFLHLNEPQRPYTPPARFASANPYDGEIVYADELVGRFLTTLEQKGMYDDALIIVTSDHGEGLGDHGEQEHGLLLYDEVIRVPLIVKMPGESTAHRVSQPVQHIDLVPTVLDLVRAPTQERLRGRSLRVLLEDRDDAPLAPQPIYAEALYGRFQFGFADVYSLTDDRYRFIAAPRPELHDLTSDPGERTNLASTHEHVAIAMADAVAKLRSDTRVDTPAPTTPADLERLVGLGYSGVRPTPPADTESPAADPKDMVLVVEAYRNAMALASARHFKEAIASLRGVVTERPEMADMWRQLGTLELRAGRTEDAVSSFQRFTALRPDRPEGSLAIARLLLDLGRFEDASKHASLALDVAPAGDVHTRAEISEVAIRAALARKDAVTARRLAAEAQALHPSLALGPYVEARLLHERGDFEGAVPLFEKAIDVSVSHTIQIGELNWYLGDTLTRLDRYAEAEKAFTRELAVAPHNIRAYASLATLYHASHRDEAAAKTIAALERAVPTAQGLGLAARLRAAFGSH